MKTTTMMGRIIIGIMEEVCLDLSLRQMRPGRQPKVSSVRCRKSRQWSQDQETDGCQGVPRTFALVEDGDMEKAKVLVTSPQVLEVLGGLYVTTCLAFLQALLRTRP